MKEYWKPIIGYENLYKISNLGNILSLRKNRILKHHMITGGYFVVQLSKKGKSRNWLVHRLVAEAFIDNPNKLPEINHKDENKANNAVSNLEWCTHEYNMNYNNLGKRAKIKKELNELYKQEERILEVKSI